MQMWDKNKKHYKHSILQEEQILCERMGTQESNNVLNAHIKAEAVSTGQYNEGIGLKQKPWQQQSTGLKILPGLGFDNLPSPGLGPGLLGI
uniref:Uncharacterized protein n=1 Tax=Romanomermis culicivorax TaxID=13658 RepID=A0A915KL15_ROMCU